MVERMVHSNLFLTAFAKLFYASLWGRIASSLSVGKGHIADTLLPHRGIYGLDSPSELYPRGSPDESVLMGSRGEEDPASIPGIVRLLQNLAGRTQEEDFPSRFMKVLRKVSYEGAKESKSKKARGTFLFSHNNLYLLSLVDDRTVLEDWNLGESLKALHRSLGERDREVSACEAVLSLHTLLSHWFPLLPKRLVEGKISLKELNAKGASPYYPLFVFRTLDVLSRTKALFYLSEVLHTDLKAHFGHKYYPDIPVFPGAESLLRDLSKYLRGKALDLLGNSHPLIKDFLPFLEEDPIQLYSFPLSKLNPRSAVMSEDELWVYLSKVSSIATELLFLVIFGVQTKNKYLYQHFSGKPYGSLDRFDVFNELLRILGLEYSNAYDFPEPTKKFLRERFRDDKGLPYLPLSLRPGRSGFPASGSHCLSYEELMGTIEEEFPSLSRQVADTLERGMGLLGAERESLCFRMSLSYMVYALSPDLLGENMFSLPGLFLVLEGFTGEEEKPLVRFILPFHMSLAAEEDGEGMRYRRLTQLPSGMPEIVSDLRGETPKHYLLLAPGEDPFSRMSAMLETDIFFSNLTLSPYGQSILSLALGYSSSLLLFEIRPNWFPEKRVEEEEEISLYEKAITLLTSKSRVGVKESLERLKGSGFFASKGLARRAFGELSKHRICLSLQGRKKSYRAFENLAVGEGRTPLFAWIVPVPPDAFERPGDKPFLPLSMRDLIEVSPSSIQLREKFDSPVHASLTGYVDRKGNLLLPLLKFSFDSEAGAILLEVEMLE